LTRHIQPRLILSVENRDLWLPEPS
jgi:hypothetical protein